MNSAIAFLTIFLVSVTTTVWAESEEAKKPGDYIFVGFFPPKLLRIHQHDVRNNYFKML